MIHHRQTPGAWQKTEVELRQSVRDTGIADPICRPHVRHAGLFGHDDAQYRRSGRHRGREHLLPLSVEGRTGRGGNGARCGAHRPSSERTPRRAQPRRDGRAAVPGRRARADARPRHSRRFRRRAPGCSASCPMRSASGRWLGASITRRSGTGCWKICVPKAACANVDIRSRESTSSAASIRSSRGSTRKRLAGTDRRPTLHDVPLRRGTVVAALITPSCTHRTTPHAALAPAACPATHHSDPISV